MNARQGRNARCRGLLLLAGLLSLVLPATAQLAREYMRNGEAYLLVGHSDPAFRGVYRVNNPAGEPDGNPLGRLYDPRDSYGIVVDLNRQVYTFSSNAAPSYTFDPSWMLSRRLKVPGGISLYGAHCDTRKSYYVSTDGVTYNQSNQPVYTTTGPMGNETGVSDGNSNIAWQWSGQVRVTHKGAGSWYIMKTAVFCDTNCIYTNGHNDQYWCHFVPVDGAGYGNVPNGAWWQSRDPDPHGRPGNLFYWDRAFRKYTRYDLMRWNKSLGVQGGGAPVYPQYVKKADEIYDEIVKRSRISACMNCVCVNGSNDNSFPTAPKYVWLAMSPFGRTYLYSRTQTSTTDGQIRLNEVPMALPAQNVIGLVNHLSTKWVGVSTRDSGSDYVYLLGTQLIRNWLTAYNINVPADFDINAVSVSDQWWLEGGIVFAYDKNNGYVYQFMRFDQGGANTCKAKPTSRYIGSDVDDVKADGFGNCYFSKTTEQPADAAIGWSDATNFVLAGISGGRHYAYLYYDQKVFKTVYCSELGSTNINQVGQVWIGNNRWRRLFSVPSTRWPLLTMSNLQAESGTANWLWHGGNEQTYFVAEPGRNQLGVINVATPPKVEKVDGRTGGVDIVGRNVYTNQPVPSYPNWASTQIQSGLYDFSVENNPEWNGRINVRTPGKSAWEGDVNGNGWNGGFVSSVKNLTAHMTESPDVLYTWRIFKIQNDYEQPLAPAQLVKEAIDSQTPSIRCFLYPGAYQIHLSAKFRWYNYEALQFGSTVASLADALRPAGGGFEIASAPPFPDPLNLLRPQHFPGFVNPPPNTAVMALRVKPGIVPDTGVYRATIQKHPTVLTPPLPTVPPTTGFANPSGIAQFPRYHVASQAQVHWWRVDPAGTLVAPNGTNVSMNIFWNLPTNPDPHIVPGSLRWVGPAQMDWNFSVRMPNGSAYTPLETSRYTDETQKNTAITFGLDFPTDPRVGSLSCRLYREWRYERHKYDSEGQWLYDETVASTVMALADVSLLVLDTEPPTVHLVNGRSILPVNPLYLGTTYGTLNEVNTHAGYTNPASFSIVVRDNNPFANLNEVCPIPIHKHDRSTRLNATLFFERGGKSLAPQVPLPAVTAPTYASAKRLFDYYTSPPVGPFSANTTPDIVGTAWNMHMGGGFNPRALMRQPLPYNPGATSSEILYVLKVADWEYFQDNTTDPTALDASRRFPANFANNSTNYNDAGALGAPHPGYAMMFSCVDSSGNVALIGGLPRRHHLGNIWVRDTLRPVIKATIRDYINSFPPETCLFGIDPYLAPIIRYDLLPTGPLWTPANTGVFYNGPLGTVRGIPHGLVSPLPGGVATHPPTIQEGMEVFLTMQASDNIATATTPQASMRVIGPVANSLFYERLANSISANTAQTYPNLRVLLQQPGVYNVTLEAEDNALDYAGNKAQNRRQVDFGIIVSPARMDIRVIDRKQNRF